MRLINTLLLTLTFLIPQAQAESLPDWFVNPPGDSMLWFYSVGMGETKQQAQQNALEELSARLQVTVDSNTQQFVESKEGNTDLYLETDSLLSTTGLIFTNIEMVKSAEYNNEIIQLIKIDRQAFFQQQHDSIKQQLTNFLPDKEELTEKNLSPTLVKLIQYNQIKSSIDNKLSLLDSYAFNTIDLAELITKLQLIAQSVSRTVGYKIVMANVDQTNATDIKFSIIKQLQTIGITSDQKEHTLSIVFAGINQEQTTTEFHFAIKMSAELIYLLDDSIIYQFPMTATVFNQSAELAEQQALESIQLQLGSYQ
ncbi:hypothetical protein GCM10008107_29850 [Psychrosphaera saromensis]|uniref:Lipoprotein LPP20-like domain-containing protein n=1 Tax=Psychrosphaera saromensis TaxID=716813 RepID=A0A2S7UYI4_9GAMM|nr:LPP20 family lipoprotein [Psychrosphaera saromensis]PQJ55054.1 hypothetical protein BTO11_16270 [Psychrosphaera saromensis]GHB78386.1 hypothetical protein GCM10008107_29850 [Psychrosphaera saromensis]GLQ13648.1 hypothetical protein GCM10007917_11030 [Psychrosphaera saromensis]